MAEPARPQSAPGLRARLHLWRARLIADPRFQRWAAGSPLTRVIARKNARALFDICAGFVYSQTLLACVRLKLFETLAAAPLTLEALAPRLGLTGAAADRLVRAAVSLRLVKALPGGLFALGDLGAACLGNPSIAEFVEHHTLLYDDLRDPVALLRGQTQTRLSQFWPYARESAGQTHGETSAAAGEVTPYSALMSSSQALIAEDILDAVPLAKSKRLMDVGGGEGAFILAAAKRHPQLQFTLFDLPAVAERARARFSQAGLSARANAVGGSFLSDPLPAGADVISLVRIAHDHDDASLRTLLRAAFAALAPGGTLLIGEPMAATAGAEPIGDAYFGFYLLAMGSGQARTPQRLKELLGEAGFGDMRQLPTRRPLLTSLIVCSRFV